MASVALAPDVFICATGFLHKPLLPYRMLAELASLRDDVNVLTAIIQRLDTKVIRLLAEFRATHSQA
jgi:hypothetical protein